MLCRRKRHHFNQLVINKIFIWTITCSLYKQNDLRLVYHMHTFWSNPMVIISVTKKRFVTLYICQILSTMIVYSIILFIRFNDKLLIFFLFISNYYIMILKIQKSCWKTKSLEMSKINLNRKNVPIYDQFVVGFFFYIYLQWYI